MVSIVIPAYNEDLNLNHLLRYIHLNSSSDLISEIIVADYSDSSKMNVDGVKIVQCPEKGRAAQMTYALEFATGDVYYFLHADSYPPPSFDRLILNAIATGEKAGCFRLKFDSRSLFLKFFSWFTRFNVTLFRGGDQSLFITKDLFDEIGGYDVKLKIMEDIDVVKRIKKKSKFKVLKQTIITSARKYQVNGIYSLQYRFAVLLLKYNLGQSQVKMLSYYNKHIK